MLTRLRRESMAPGVAVLNLGCARGTHSPRVSLVLGRRLAKIIVLDLDFIHDVSLADRRVVLAGPLLFESARLVGRGEAADGPVDAGENRSGAITFKERPRPGEQPLAAFGSPG